MSPVDSSLVFVTLPASPGYDQVRVDLSKEVLSSRLPAIVVSEGHIITRLLFIWPRHANVLGQEVNEHLQIWGKGIRYLS